ncbi:MAG TPA: adenosylcobinamide-GDP ribazoletransferase [Gaiella sp.]|jgi:cobalamin 5'-phosphate synthase/cobalamin synthase
MTAAEPVRAGLAAVAFLTRVPVGRAVALDARDVARGAVLFPLVGAAIGAASGVLADLLTPGLPGLVAGGLAVGLAALVTGAMHLDALADTLDALGGATRERALEIMRDHSIGAFGAIGICLVCLVNASALGALGSQNAAWLGALVAGAAGRAAILPLARTLPYARAGGGQGRVLEGIGWSAVAVGVLLAVALAAAAGWAGVAAAAAAFVVVFALLLFFRGWLGGVTGDCLGATAALCETAALVAFLAAR